MSDGVSPRTIADSGWLAAAALQSVLKVLGGENGEARIAGGAVRNALLGEEIADIDIATVHEPDEVTRRCEAAGFSVHPTGVEHGTVTVVVHKGDVAHTFEVTTLRVDVETYGRHARVGFTADWQADAARRDFTINALYCDADGTIFDPLGGLADIETRTVRFAGDPHARIREDYLRILRFFRFYARYGDDGPDAESLAACRELRDGLRQLSAERVRAELFKLLVAPRAAEAVKLMADAGILALLLPGAGSTGVLERLVAIDAANGFDGDPVVRLVALGASDDGLAERLRLSNDEARRLAALSAGGALSPGLRDNERKSMLYHMGAQMFHDAVRLAWAGNGADANDEGWCGLVDLADRWPVPQFPVSGADLLECGYQPGPELGAQLQALEDWWIAAGFPEDKTAVLAQLKKSGE